MEQWSETGLYIMNKLILLFDSKAEGNMHVTKVDLINITAHIFAIR